MTKLFRNTFNVAFHNRVCLNGTMDDQTKVVYYLRKYALVVISPLIFAVVYGFLAGPGSVENGLRRGFFFLVEAIALFLINKAVYKNNIMGFLGIAIFLVLTFFR